MSAELERVLREVVSEVAFLFFDHPQAEPAAASEVWAAEIEVRSASALEQLRLVVTPPVARELVANMMGLEPDSPEAAAAMAPAVAELLNIVAGAWAVEHFGATARCELSIPTVTHGPPAAPLGDCATAWVDGLEPIQLMRPS